jgi:hypothetical protein
MITIEVPEDGGDLIDDTLTL